MGWVVLGKMLSTIPRISPSSFSTPPPSHPAATFSGPHLAPLTQVPRSALVWSSGGKVSMLVLQSLW